MKRIFISLLLCLSSLSVTATNLQHIVDQRINQVDPSINMSMLVVDLSTGETLYQRNNERALVPASNMKLFSDAAALLALGPDFRFQTKLSTDANVLEQGILKGSLYLSLSGDPSFTQDDLSQLLASLPALSIQQIQGNVILVSGNQVVSAYAPGRAASDFKYSYGAPIAPLILDENRATVTVNPAYRPGLPALIELNHQTQDIAITNQVKTVASGTHCGIDFNMDEAGHLTVRGCIGVGQWAVQERLAIRNPLSYAQNVIKNRLAQLHIQFDGQVLLGNAPQTAILLASHASKPITQLMADTLKPSDNLYADSLFLQSAAKLSGTPLNWEPAQNVVKAFLQKQTGISLQSAILTDGSGLSRQDLLSAEQTVALLRYLHERFPLAYEYIAALPIAGQDGTLRKRFRKPSQQGMLRAKTGTMTGVISLSGYLYTANAHTLAFAIFINKRPGTKPAISGRYRPLVDSLCDFFLMQKPDNRILSTAAHPHARVAFQSQPSQADKQRHQYARWRQIESMLKQKLQGQAVTVLFRNNQLVLQDHAADANKVWNILNQVSKKYPFTVALTATSAPNGSKGPPMLLWIKAQNQNAETARTWTLREAVIARMDAQQKG